MKIYSDEINGLHFLGDDDFAEEVSRDFFMKFHFPQKSELHDGSYICADVSEDDIKKLEEKFGKIKN